MTTVLGRLAPEVSRTGVLEADNDAQKVQWARFEADGHDWG